MNTALLVALVLSLRGDLAHRSYPVRHAAQSRVARLGPACLPAVDRLAADPDPDVAEWAAREARHKRRQAADLRAGALMESLDPQEWRTDSYGYPTDEVKAACNLLTGGLYADPEMAVAWAELARREHLFRDDELEAFCQVFAGRTAALPAVGPDPVWAGRSWADHSFGYWQIRTVWERLFIRAVFQSIPAPRVVPTGNT